MNSIDIELVSVSKSFGPVSVVKDISLQIPRGEFVSILGPSGCGKTTTLNMIAGFNAPSYGDIRIRGKSQVRVPPERRNIGLVFQNYALFPHMTVAENVGFGLRMRGASRSEIAVAVRDALRGVHLEAFAARYPKELSGGQQQRVALARAIAPRPSVLLLDEPLSNLDLKLREAMRVELKEIQEALGMTFVYVTHDQEEAMAMSDRIVVMWQGVIAQEGTPADIYGRPQTSFVADFIGRSNILPISDLVLRPPHLDFAVADGALRLRSAAAWSGQDMRFCCIRPESIRFLPEGEPAPEDANQLTGRLHRIVNLGAQLELFVEIASDLLVSATLPSGSAGRLPPLGKEVRLSILAQDVQLLAR
ncbi:ABC transporter ATP-binding protein [Rhizobium sp. KAs_5_22]|uniref:ABC transporter ATP-binding protein n=1 Tax=Ciceribacter selenitireducens TaxID=448181 RepID=UPI00048DE8F5|nr:ABC transporter ATP-binding protein [Ciceribacter selenitireducens]PPJ49191.1 ABC transporter ATP-binding protein [Rhizobium sp. KAs_5_22]